MDLNTHLEYEIKEGFLPNRTIIYECGQKLFLNDKIAGHVKLTKSCSAPPAIFSLKKNQLNKIE